jgi:hypothetical protein
VGRSRFAGTWTASGQATVTAHGSSTAAVAWSSTGTGTIDGRSPVTTVPGAGDFDSRTYPDLYPQPASPPPLVLRIHADLVLWAAGLYGTGTVFDPTPIREAKRTQTKLELQRQIDRERAQRERDDLAILRLLGLIGDDEDL